MIPPQLTSTHLTFSGSGSTGQRSSSEEGSLGAQSREATHRVCKFFPDELTHFLSSSLFVWERAFSFLSQRGNVICSYMPLIGLPPFRRKDTSLFQVRSELSHLNTAPSTSPHLSWARPALRRWEMTASGFLFLKALRRSWSQELGLGKAW